MLMVYSELSETESTAIKKRSNKWILSMRLRSNWTKEKCLELSLLCDSRKEFQTKYRNAYDASNKGKWMDEICGHMKLKPSELYTLEKCIEICKKYTTRNPFIKENRACYMIIYNNEWEDIVFAHMIEVKKPQFYWDKEKCFEAASKCDNIIEFNKKYRGAYQASFNNEWIDEIQFENKNYLNEGNRFKRYVYAYEFEDNHVYVGISYSITKRDTQHISSESSAVFQHLKICSKYKIVYITNKPIFGDDALILEGETVKKYRDNNWNILNRRKTGLKHGGLGGGIIYWDKEKSFEVFRKFRTIAELCKQHDSLYHTLIKRKVSWLKDITSHMAKWSKKLDKYDYNKCLKESKKYNNSIDFKKYSPDAYKSAVKFNWLFYYPNLLKWNFESCKKEALKYKTKKEFFEKCPVAYNSANRAKVMNIICSHMDSKYHKWTYEKLEYLAFKHKTKTEFRKKCEPAFQYAFRNKLLDKLFPKK
jgi:hypothetical protein